MGHLLPHHSFPRPNPGGPSSLLLGFQGERSFQSCFPQCAAGQRGQVFGGPRDHASRGRAGGRGQGLKLRRVDFSILMHIFQSFIFTDLCLNSSIVNILPCWQVFSQGTRRVLYRNFKGTLDYSGRGVWSPPFSHGHTTQADKSGKL